MIGNPRILILDEATSALDLDSERALLMRMPDICRGRTVIVITHRLSMLRGVKRVILLDDGCIAEDGAPADLLARGGLFATLWRQQAPSPAGVQRPKATDAL